MHRNLLMAGAAALALAACQASENANESGGNAAATDLPSAGPAAGSKAGEPKTTLAAAAAQTPELSTLVKAVKSAGLEATLAGPENYTLFAPADAAFQKLPAGQVDAMMQPDKKAQLTSIITYHLVPGVVTAADLGRAIDNGGGKAQLATVGGVVLSLAKQGDTIVVTDGAGNKATVTRADLTQSNGVIHMIDGVLAPQ